MKLYLSLVFVLLIPFASIAGKRNPKKHFEFSGQVLEMNLKSEKEKPVRNASITVYQDGELYVFFETTENGTFNFNLPIGHDYVIDFGGNKLVSKKIQIDASKCPKNMTATKIDFDVVLFEDLGYKPIKCLEKPIAFYAYDPGFKTLIPNDDYTYEHSLQLKKELRKVKRNSNLAKN
jgi:hypothetical protein